MGPKSNDKWPYKRQKRRRRHREKERSTGEVKAKAETGMIHTATGKEHGAPRSWRRQARTSPRASRAVLLGPHFALRAPASRMGESQFPF